MMSNSFVPEEDEINGISEFFKVFGDPTRLKILFFLERGEASVNVISSSLNISQSTSSQHLKLLRVSRLVSSRKDGKNTFYKLNDHHISQILLTGKQHFEEE